MPALLPHQHACWHPMLSLRSFCPKSFLSEAQWLPTAVAGAVRERHRSAASSVWLKRPCQVFPLFSCAFYDHPHVVCIAPGRRQLERQLSLCQSLRPPPWESHAVLELGKQQQLEETSADLLSFCSRERLPGGRSCGSHTDSA